MERYQLERQDADNRWLWHHVASSDDYYSLLDLIPLQQASQYRLIDWKCRSARRGHRLIGSQGSTWKHRKNARIKLRQKKEQGC